MKIKCKLCESIYHPKCVSMTNAVCEFVSTSVNTTWLCDTCLQKDIIMCVLNKLTLLEKKIDGNTVKLSEIDSKKYVPVPNSASISVNSATPKRRLADIVADNTTVNEDPGFRSAKRVKTTTNKQSTVRDKNQPVIVVSTTDDTVKRDLLNTVKASLDPLNDPVAKVTHTANGKVVVHCKNDATLNTIKKKLSAQIKSKVSNVNIAEPVALQPRLHVLGVDAEYITEASVDNGNVSDKDNEVIALDVSGQQANPHDAVADNAQLIKMITKQNAEMMHEHSKLEVWGMKKRKDGKYNVTITCDTTTMRNIMMRQRLKIGWDNCIVYEHINLYRCFSCNRYGHSSSECNTGIPTCPRCAGDHKVSECKPDAVICCSNCKHYNEKNRLNEPTDHPVWDNRCPILQMKFNRRKERIRYAS